MDSDIQVVFANGTLDVAEHVLGSLLVVVHVLEDGDDGLEVGLVFAGLLLVELHGGLEEFDLWDVFLDLDLELNLLTEWLAMLSMELEGGWDGSGRSCVSHLDWDDELEGRLGGDLEVDWDDNNIENQRGELIEVGLEGSSFLPGPLHTVLDLDLSHDNLTWLTDVALFADLHDRSLLVLPVSMIIEVFTVWTTPLLWTPWTVSSAASAALATSASELLGKLRSLSELLLHVVDAVHHLATHVSEESWVLLRLVDLLLDVGLGVGHVLVDDGEHSLWHLLWLVDLEESVVMTSSLFAHGAEVEVLAD